MELDGLELDARAREFIGASGPVPRLGWGIGGVVYLAPGGLTAVKIHRRREGYETEVRAYGVLARANVRSVCGLHVPTVHRTDDRLFAIQMDVVPAPYLLDFAGVRFGPPDFAPDVVEDWHRRIDEFFAPNTSVVYAVDAALQRLGIWYLDFRPSNLKLDGLPGLRVPTEQIEESE